MSFDWSQADSHFDGVGRVTSEGEERAHVDWGVGSDYQPPKKHFADDWQDSSPLTDDSWLTGNLWGLPICSMTAMKRGF